MRAWMLAAAVVVALRAMAADDAFFAGKLEAVICRDTAAPGGRVLVCDVGKPSGTAFRAPTAVLPAGLHVLHLPVRLSAMNSVNTAPLRWRVTISGEGEGERTFDMLWVEQAGRYQTLPVPFTMTRQGRATVALTWERVGAALTGAGVRLRVEKGELPKAGQALGEAPVEELEVVLEDEPDLATVKHLHMAIAPPTTQVVAEVAVTALEVDKIRYRPGERAAIRATVRNFTASPQTVTAETVLVHELAATLPVDRRPLELAAGAQTTLELHGPPMTAKWGYAVRVVLHQGDRAVHQREEYFTVHDNMWAIMQAGRMPAQFTAHITQEKAAAAALDNQRRYRNWVESGFWAPDEFGDFTPDSEFWWGGQGCYYGSVTGTKLMIAEGHRRGLSFAVYSNIWGGDGPPAFELIREHPDWGYPGGYNTEWFERWDRNTMGTGKPGPGLHVWPYTIINSKLEEPFRHHGRELIATHRMFGWDAVRYDSHSIDSGTARMVELGREVVWAELPGFQYGYNSSVPHGIADKMDAFKAQCRNEGMIMEEGIRGYGEDQSTYAAFAERLLSFKAEARQHGGHFTAIGMDKCFKNDLLFQYILWFAGNTHMCYDWEGVTVANYPQFATRHAGLLWDLAVTTVPDAKRFVDYGKADGALFRWPDFVHQRDLGEGRRQVILHLINTPLETVLYTHDDCKLPPPLQDLPVNLKLPAGATVQQVWQLTADHGLSQAALPFQVTDGQLTTTVPRLRFWQVVVVELTSPKGYE